MKWALTAWVMGKAFFASFLLLCHFFVEPFNVDVVQIQKRIIYI
jgi:hypothetical protein